MMLNKGGKMVENFWDVLNYEILLYDPNEIVNLDDMLDEFKNKFRYVTNIKDIVESDLLLVK